MSRLPSLLLTLTAVVAPVVGAVGGVEAVGGPEARPAASAAAASAVCAGGDAIPARLLVRAVGCDLTGRTVRAGAAEVVVPPPGQGVAARGAGEREASLTVVNDGGRVTAWTKAGATPRPSRAVAGGGAGTRPHPAADPGNGPTRGAPSACTDGTYRLYGLRHRWLKRVAWSYNDAGRVRSLAETPVLRALKASARTMARGRTDCDLGARIDARVGYLGETSARPSISGTKTGASCGRGDTVNVVGWGPIGGDSLGWTCVYWNVGGAMIGGDVLLKPSRVFSLGVPSGCVFRLDLQSLMTHEWGHVLGLDHVDQTHENLVMPHLVEVCSTSDRTLGRGDFLGLRALYGTR